MIPPSPLLPLTVLTGFDRDTVADVAAGLLLRTPRTALVWVDPTTAAAGFLHCRVTDSDGRCSERIVQLQHGCVSCALRDGVEHAVRALAGSGRYDSVLVHLAPGIESAAAVAALDAGLAGTARVDTVASVLHTGWLDDLAGGADVTERGIAVLPGDDRSTAIVLASNLDAASVLVLPGVVRDRLCLEEHATLSTVCPDVVRLYPTTGLDVSPSAVLRTRSYDATSRGAHARRGLLDPHVVLPNVSGAVDLVRWLPERRPVHPQRLYDALPEIARGVFRSTGRLWVATHPELLVRWDSAGDRLALGPEGSWHGIRPDNHVAFLGTGLGTEHILATLDATLLTDSELASGPAAWQRFPDPFLEWRPDADEQGVA